MFAFRNVTVCLPGFFAPVCRTDMRERCSGALERVPALSRRHGTLRDAREAVGWIRRRIHRQQKGTRAKYRK